MRAETGLVLRLAGFLIELPCAMGLVSVRGKGRTVAGMPAETALLAGLVLGALVWVAGMVATRLAHLKARDE